MGAATPVTAIDKVSLVVTMLLAILFLDERVSWKAGLGVLLIVAGSILASTKTPDTSETVSPDGGVNAPIEPAWSGARGLTEPQAGGTRSNARPKPGSRVSR